jgi:hypothetical protein
MPPVVIRLLTTPFLIMNTCSGFGSMCFGWGNAQAVQCCFFEPLQLHLKLADLLEQLSLLGLAFVLGLRLLAPGEQVAGTLQQLLLPLAHLDRVHRMISGDLLERLAATDRLHGDLGLELGAMGAAFAHRWDPPLRGSAPPHRLTMEPVQKSQTTSAQPLSSLL